MDALIIQPWHIATRGRFDGEYGIATRGIAVCPSLVNRLPVKGEVMPERLLGHISENDLEAVLREHGWFGTVAGERFGLEGAWAAASTLTAEVTGLDLLEATVSAIDPLSGLVTCLEAVSADIATGGTVGEASGSEGSAQISGACQGGGEVTDADGEGACDACDDVEPC